MQKIKNPSDKGYPCNNMESRSNKGQSQDYSYLTGLGINQPKLEQES